MSAVLQYKQDHPNKFKFNATAPQQPPLSTSITATRSPAKCLNFWVESTLTVVINSPYTNGGAKSSSDSLIAEPTL